MDPTPLREAYRAFLDAARTVAASPTTTVPPPGEWNTDQILAHVSLVSAATITAVSSTASGGVTTYDNRLALDTWTLDRVIALAGGTTGLRERVRHQAEALCALSGPTLSDTELDTPLPALLLSHDTVLVNGPVPLRTLITGLTEVELPGHRAQLLALVAGGERPVDASAACPGSTHASKYRPDMDKLAG
ncbi:hypothetical protein ABZT03_21190 [Streptomyces sp. NPDC005574]|uniref:hypothetical protein n=1 Tax=Streptomyces sp. NPDC005574 TaxID=3156891 RepID=UPI0033BA7A21